jgi:hypothetical protein
LNYLKFGIRLASIPKTFVLNIATSYHGNGDAYIRLAKLEFFIVACFPWDVRGLKVKFLSVSYLMVSVYMILFYPEKTSSFANLAPFTV